MTGKADLKLLVGSIPAAQAKPRIAWLNYHEIVPAAQKNACNCYEKGKKVAKIMLSIGQRKNSYIDRSAFDGLHYRQMRKRVASSKSEMTETEIYSAAWRALRPAERLQRSWHMRKRMPNLRAVHDAKTFQKL